MSEYTSGFATSEQEVLSDLSTFVTTNLGWTLLDTVSDTSSNRDYVFFKKGTGGYRDIYTRVRAQSGYLYFYGYTHWVSSAEYSDQIYNSSYSRLTASSSSINYWFFGGDDYVTGVINESTSYRWFYLGFISPYASVATDDLPLCIAGHYSDSYAMSSSNKAYMYTPFTLVSGNWEQVIGSTSIYTVLNYGSPNDRDDSIAMLPAIATCNVTGWREVRGEYQGIMVLGGAGVTSEDWITVSGTSSKYFVLDIADNNALAFGPVSV